MSATRKLCIHGHFYQPPRTDPWMRELLPEGSAGPGLNWNRRILQESYAPLAWARRRDGHGRITDIVNCYAWVSFNFGPTLLSWLEHDDPQCYARILEADRLSLERWGHGNALAQCYHHMIMPLASELDKDVQLAWTAADFQARYGRMPEGLWLSEAAVDTPTLEAVARAGFRFVILAPRQALAVADLNGAHRIQVDESTLDIREPYAALLPSGQSLAVFFYHGPLSQAVAFERLLEDGERFWQRVNQAASSGLLSLATDGETYGHHFPFGEMALAYFLEQVVQGRDGLELTNYGAYLASNPPQRRVYLKEPSSWSCIHGVERWRSDCGCTDGGHPGWNQHWREPLRRALTENKQRVDKLFFNTGQHWFTDPRQALLEYGRVLAGSLDRRVFLERYGLPGSSPETKHTAFDLLAMQEWAMCSLASCAWFFDEISRVEPLNAMAYALRSMELARACGGEDWTDSFTAVLAEIRSNLPDKGSGADLWCSHVLPRSMNPATWTLLGLLLSQARDRKPEQGRLRLELRSADLELHVRESAPTQSQGHGLLTGAENGAPKKFTWHWTYGETPDDNVDAVHVVVDGQGEFFCTVADLAWNKRQLITLAWLERQAESWWNSQLDFASRAAVHFLEWQEDQHHPNREEVWRLYLPALAWTFIVSAESSVAKEETRLFLQRNWQPNQEFDARLAAHLLSLLADEDPDWLALELMAGRIRTLGLPINLWPVENRLWEMRHLPEVKALAPLFGFRES
ncbi:DUF3536 domain-containing protein [Desulfonatronum parangueonense]